MPSSTSSPDRVTSSDQKAEPVRSDSAVVDVVDIADVAVDGMQVIGEDIAPGMVEAVVDGAVDILEAVFSAIDL